MTDREKLLRLLDGFQVDSIDAILNCFLNVYGDELSIKTIRDMAKTLNNSLGNRVDELERLRFIANERAGYIKKYLEGKMWPDEETAKFYLQPQIDNAQAILDACNGD